MILRPLLAALVALAPLPALAQDLTPDQTAKVDKIVADALATSGVPSASISIVREGRIVYAKAYGDQGPGLPTLSTDAKYPIASVSKQFTAAALLLLEDEGKLSLDDKVAKYFPDVSGADRISLRQLLSHTAGLQDYWPQDYSFAAMEKPVTPQGIVDRWGKKPLDFEPGTAWQYSNTGYVVAGMIVEKVSGRKLLDYLNAKIFRPLGMHPVDMDKAVGRGYPTPMRRFALGPVRPATPAASGWLWAAGELAMSASDLAKWNIARIDRKVLPVDDWAAQEKIVNLTDGAPTGYGLGVFIGTRNGLHTITHGGAAVGFLTSNVVVPDRRFAVSVLVNGEFGRAQEAIANGITDLLYPPPLSPAPPVDLRDILARKVYDQLRTGKLDRSLLTDNANYYFTDVATSDYRDTLGPLGEPDALTLLGKPRLRGGFVNRNYTVRYGDKRLLVVTYAEPGANGRFEQFMVMPLD